MNPIFTILLSVHRPPAMLPYAIETVLSQTVPDFELFVICDGAPEATLRCAQDYARRDPRVKVFPFPKGAHTGMEHRHTALAEANGRLVAHIGDDDLWFPDHLEEMEKLLSKVDFGHTINVSVMPNGRFETLASDLGDCRIRQRQLNAVASQFAECVTGYHIAAYRSLEQGWTGLKVPFPDLYVWRKFLSRDEMKCGTSMHVTALVFASEDEDRPTMSLEQRRRENALWYGRLLDPDERERIREEAWRALMRYVLLQEDDRTARMAVIHALQAQLKRMQQLSGYRLPDDRTIDFSENGNSPLYTVTGWGDQEADRRWTDGKEAVLRVALEPSASGLDVIRLRAVAFRTPQRVTILINGNSPAELTVEPSWRDYDIALGDCAHPAESELKFLLPDAHSPKSVGLSDDARDLGIGLSSLTFLPLAPPNGGG